MASSRWRTLGAGAKRAAGLADDDRLQLAVRHRYDCAWMKTLGRAGKGPPDNSLCLFPVNEEQLDTAPRFLLVARQSSRQDLGFVDHQRIARAQKLDDI